MHNKMKLDEISINRRCLILFYSHHHFNVPFGYHNIIFCVKIDRYTIGN